MKILKLIAFLLTLSQQDVFARPQDSLSDEYIEWVQSKASTWKAGRNFPKDTSKRFLKKLMGVLEDRLPIDMDKYSYEKQMGPLPENFELPPSFDARERWPNCPTIKEIRDQGACGSCWAASSVEVMSDRTCSMSDGKFNFHYSLEDLLSCCSSCGLGCVGGHPFSAYDYWINYGIVSGGQYNSSLGCSPYLIAPCEHHINGTRPSCEDYQNTPRCEQGCESDYPIQYKDDLRLGQKAYRFKTVEEGQYDLVTNGPLSATYNVYEDFLSYKSGVYQHIRGSKYLGGHAIKVIGYGIEDGVSYWLCANSWNTDWGDQGFFKILRGKDECSIEDNFMAGIPLF